MSGCVKPGDLTLTFEGGSSIHDALLLDTLQKHNVTAAFFLKGSTADANSDMIKRMKDSGHTIGAYSQNAPYLTRLSDDQIHDEMILGDLSINAYTAEFPRFARHPNNQANDASTAKLLELGYIVIGQNLDSNDTSKAYQMDAGQMLTSLESQISAADATKDSFIVRFHDTMASSLPDQLDALIDFIDQKTSFRIVDLMTCAGGAGVVGHTSEVGDRVVQIGDGYCDRYLENGISSPIDCAYSAHAMIA